MKDNWTEEKITGVKEVKKIEQWTQEKIIEVPTKKTLKEYVLSKKEIHYNAEPTGNNIIIETYTKGHWSMDPDIHHIYEE